MKKYLILAFMSLMLLSCTQESEITVEPDITSYRFDPSGGSLDVVIFTNGSWTATCADPTVTLTPDSGDYTAPMHITVGPNLDYRTKSIRVELVSRIEGKSRNGRIVLTQDCLPFIFCEEPSVRIGAAGGTARFSVNSNAPWKVAGTTMDGDSFSLPVDPLRHDANRVEVSVLIPSNDSGKVRTFTVTLALEENSSTKVVLTVSQEA